MLETSIHYLIDRYAEKIVEDLFQKPIQGPPPTRLVLEARGYLASGAGYNRSGLRERIKPILEEMFKELEGKTFPIEPEETESGVALALNHNELDAVRSMVLYGMDPVTKDEIAKEVGLSDEELETINKIWEGT